jgi:hypothetical protein
MKKRYVLAACIFCFRPPADAASGEKIRYRAGCGSTCEFGAPANIYKSKDLKIIFKESS